MKSFDTFLEDIDPAIVMLGMTHDVKVKEYKNALTIFIEKEESSVSIQVKYNKENFHKFKRLISLDRNITYDEYMENSKPEVEVYTHGKLVKEVTKLIMREVEV